MSIKTKYILGWLAIMLVLLAPLIFYFSIFGPESEYSLSRSDDAWASFGSFIGGTLGPLFSGLAFIGVWLTYQEIKKQLQAQQEQLNFVKSQATIDELQRLLATTIDAFEDFMSQPIGIRFGDEIYTREDALQHASAMANGNLSIPDPIFMYLHNREHTSFEAQHHRYIECIAWCMNEFIKAGGNEKLIEYYNIKLGRKISNSRACGWIHDKALIVVFFPNYV